MLRASWAMLGESIPDLLDRSTNHVAGPALRKAVAILPAEFALASFRSRGTPRAFALEVGLACAPGTDVEIALSVVTVSGEDRPAAPADGTVSAAV